MNTEFPPSLVNSDPLNGFLTVYFNKQSRTIHASNPNFAQALALFKEKDFDKLEVVMSPAIAINKAIETYGNIEVRDGLVWYKSNPLHNVVTERILDFLSNGLDILPVVKFLDKLMSNPSKRAVDELYTFLEHKNLPITSNGNFLAYKGVDDQYFSITAARQKTHLIQGTQVDGKILNSVGEVVEIERNAVNDDKEIGCSYGLHAGSVYYANLFRGLGKLMVVEINPKDVVSIPVDCNFQKLRTCKYKVIEEMDTSELQPKEQPLYESGFEDDEYYDDDFYEDDDIREDDFGYPLKDGSAYTLDGKICIWDEKNDEVVFVDYPVYRTSFLDLDGLLTPM